MPRLQISMGKCLIKNAILGVSRWKAPKFYPHKSFCLFALAEMFLWVALFLEVYSVLKTGCMPGWPAWLADKSKEMFGFWIRSLCFKVYFLFIWHQEFPYTDLLQFKHKCTYLFATNLTNKQYTKQEQS